MSASSAKSRAHQRRLARTVVQVPAGPGQPARSVAALDLVHAAERSLAVEDFGQASQIAEQLRRTPGLTGEGLRLLLLMALALGRPRDVLEYTRQLATVGVTDARASLALAQGLEFCNRHAEALRVVEEALREAPADAGLHHLRGQLLIVLDEPDAAEAALRRVLRLQPRQYAPYRQLALLGRITPDDVAQLEKALVPDAAKADAWMALAAGYRRLGDHAQEFAWLARAHQVLRSRDPWFPEEEHAMARDIAATFTPEFLAQLPELPPGAERPIFVVGMPRAGSTLAEQILVSTGAAGGAGESQVFPWLLLDLNMRRHPGLEYPQVVPALTAEDLAGLQREYLRTIHEVFTPAPVFVDKQFTNYKFVGLLARLFPDAVFVHTVRDPLDIILSTWQHAFPNLGFSHDLEHLAMAWQDRAAIMAHWHAVLPGRIHDLVYEDLVREPELTLRRLFEFCRLPWSDEVLRFHESRHAAKTASVLQVRQPFYQSSVGRWRPYAELLEPARRLLHGSRRSG